MKIRLLTCRAGRGLTQREGDEIEVSGAEGKRLIAAGQAEPIPSPAGPIESQAQSPPENAALPRPKPRKRKP